MKRFGTAFVLGKFMPPHAGHLHLIDEAARQSENVVVLLCSVEAEPIPGTLRFEWMNALRNQHTILHCTEEVPQAPEEHPAFWPIWEDLLRRWLPPGVEAVFSSEEYGDEIARRLGVEHVLVDPGRLAVPVSGREIRTDPVRYWDYIPKPVRPYFVQRVAILGPESSGKSRLAEALARRFRTSYVQEYGREHTAEMGNRVSQEIVFDDFWAIAHEHARRVDAAARHADRVLFADTDALTTAVWSDWYLGAVEERLWSFVESHPMDHYLLCAPDLPWEDDGTREFPHRRTAHFERLRSELEARDRPYRVIRGQGPDRVEAAVRAVLQAYPALAGPPFPRRKSLTPPFDGTI